MLRLKQSDFLTNVIMNIRFSLLLLFVLSSSAGCTYFENRARDLGDCFKASADIGLGIQAAAVVGPVEANAGVWWGYSPGLKGAEGINIFSGGDLGFPFSTAAGALGFYGGPLFTSIYEHSIESGNEANSKDKSKRILCLLFFRYEILPQRWKDYFWIEARARCFIGATVGFNIAEFADFLLGWFGIDICGDDDRGKKSPSKDVIGSIACVMTEGQDGIAKERRVLR